MPITQVSEYPLYLTVNVATPAKSVKELVAHAKANSSKGNHASPATTFELLCALFEQRTGTKFVTLPFKSNAQFSLKFSKTTSIAHPTHSFANDSPSSVSLKSCSNSTPSPTPVQLGREEIHQRNRVSLLDRAAWDHRIDIFPD